MIVIGRPVEITQENIDIARTSSDVANSDATHVAPLVVANLLGSDRRDVTRADSDNGSNDDDDGVDSRSVRRDPSPNSKQGFPWPQETALAIQEAAAKRRQTESRDGKRVSVTNNGAHDVARDNNDDDVTRNVEDIANIEEAVAVAAERRQYSIIYADPPWQYECDDHLAAPKTYESMSLDELKRVPVESLALPDAALLLWTTGHMMNTAIKLMEAWGFHFETVFANWIKIDSIGDIDPVPSRYTHSATEHVLLGTRGWLSTSAKKKEDKTRVGADARVEGDVRARALAHSQKPGVFADKIVRVFGDLPRIELFARRTRPDWDVVGNQSRLLDG